MKILQINTWYKIGSTGKLVESLHVQSLERGFDSFVLFGRGKLEKDDLKTKKIFKFSTAFESKTNSVLSRFSGVMYGGCFFSTKKVESLIKSIKPNIIHIHCTNSFVVNNYEFFKFIGEHNYKVVITLHAEYLYTGSCSHSFECNQWINGCQKCERLKQATRSILLDRTKSSWIKMHHALSFIDTKNRKIIAVSSWLKDKASISATFKNDCVGVIENGINTRIFKYYDDENNDFVSLKKSYKKIFLYLTPTFNEKETDIKGGDYFLKLVNHFSEHKDVLFVVAGGNKYNFDFSKYNNIRYLGNIVDQKKLAMLYSISDLTLMLSRKETYSLVTAESISCGTKVVGFKSGGPESIALPEYSTFFDFGDLDSVILELEKDVERTNKKGIDYYSDKKMAESYFAVYEELMKNN